jgi:hypothetical protein
MGLYKIKTSLPHHYELITVVFTADHQSRWLPLN